jgi:hypothetical protein
MSAMLHGSPERSRRRLLRRLRPLRRWVFGISICVACGWLIGSMG